MIKTTTAAKTGTKAELIAALTFVLSQLAPEGSNGEQCALYSDCLSPKDTDDETVVEYLRSVLGK